MKHIAAAAHARHAARLLAMALLAWLLAACGGAPPRTVVLIGGAASEGPGRHDYPAGVRALEALLRQAPESRRALRVVAFPDGWPADVRQIEAADTLVWYFDGMDRHPLRDPARRAAFEAAMRRGAGLVVLHQASTVPPDDDLGLPPWLGAVRAGMFDRTTEHAELVPSAHPVARGLRAFAYRDEFYPTFRPAQAGGTRTTILGAVLHPQFRDGQAVVEDLPERVDVAWAYERAGGGRSVTFTGAHYTRTFDQPEVRRLLLNAVLWTVGLDVPATPLADEPAVPPREQRAQEVNGTVTRATFHVDAARSGWRADETVLAPDALGEDRFGLLWESPPLDAHEGQPARLYATPLYVDKVDITAGQHAGERFDVVFAASNNGVVYAVNAARNGDVAPGRILWKTRLGEPCRLQPAPLDGVPTGILGTPVVDVPRRRLYVTHCDPGHRWQAHALDIGSGEPVEGWPVRLDEGTFNDLNANPGPQRVPPKRRFDFRVQRGALNLSPDGAQLYVVFGESETGWIAAVDTARARVSSAFAAVAMPHRGSGGIWGAGGPVVDEDGHVYVVTGSGFGGYQDSPGDWAQSVLKLAPPGPGGFALRGTYTPFNYCTTAEKDIDLGSGGAALLPAAGGAAPRLLAVGGKQGNVYLLDRDRLPGALDKRQSCGTDPSRDGSLLAPQPQPQFGQRGPLNVFGPYSEDDAALDLARARAVPAFRRGADGAEYVYVTGNSKRGPGSPVSVPPSIVRLRVVRPAGATPYLRVDKANTSLVLGNPGSPVVTSNGARDAIVWVLDENAPRSALLSGADAPRPVLYALDADTLDVLWRSAPGELFTSGKYNEPAFGGGLVFVGSDRVQAFGPGGRRLADRAAPVAEQAPATTPTAPSAEGLDAAALYAQRCAMCHDHPQGNIPSRAVIAGHPYGRIVAALTTGVMRPHAQGLSVAQIEELARYVKQ